MEVSVPVGEITPVYVHNIVGDVPSWISGLYKIHEH